MELLPSYLNLTFQSYLFKYICELIVVMEKKKNFDSPETGTLEEDWTGTKMAYTKNYLK